MPNAGSSCTRIKNGVDTTTRPPGRTSLTQVAGGAERVIHVLDHLLADHHVEAARLRDTGAQVEGGIGQVHVCAPRMAGVVGSGDLGGRQLLGPQRGQVGVHGLHQPHALPLLGTGSGLGKQDALARPAYLAAAALRARHATQGCTSSSLIGMCSNALSP